MAPLLGIQRSGQESLRRLIETVAWGPLGASIVDDRRFRLLGPGGVPKLLWGRHIGNIGTFETRVKL